MESDEKLANTDEPIEKKETIDVIEKPIGVSIFGRDILDLGKHIKNPEKFIQYAELPENNLKMFLTNRSQYHRLSENGQNQEYDLAQCNNCDLIYPVNGYDNSNDGVYINANANVKNNVSLAVGIKAGVLSGMNESCASPNQQIQSPAIPAYSQAASFQPPSYDDFSGFRQQQHQQNPAFAALLSNQEPTPNLNSSYGNNNMPNAFNRMFSNNANNMNFEKSANVENLAAALINYGSGSYAQSKHLPHYLNQVVPPSNYGYYKQF